MMPSVEVRAPCRLHFGMFSFGHTDQPQYGGVGLMIDPPAVEVQIGAAPCLHLRCALAHRVQHFVDLAAHQWRLPEPPACEIAVRSPRDHVGLGVGTQLGLAVAAGLRRYLNLHDLTPQELAQSVRRGARSAVGTYGFHHGGLIVDGGKRPGESLGKLVHRAHLPESWRFALITPADRQGFAAGVEADAFARLPPVPADVTRELWRITEQEMLPAIGSTDCRAFGAAVYRFGHLAGECFTPVQEGAFACPQIAALVSEIRDYGITGVGQSSWGPTVFAILPNDDDAKKLAVWLCERRLAAASELVIARPNNHGASISSDH